MDIHSLVSEYKRVEREIGKKPTRDEFLKNTKVTDWQLRKITFNEVIKAAGDEPKDTKFKNGHDLNLPEIPISVTRNPRILFLDLEIFGLIVESYGIYEQNIRPDDIISDWVILSYAAKFNDEETIHYLDQRYSTPVSDDRQLVEGIHHLIKQADFICAHNIPFDWGKLNARFIKYGLEPLFPSLLCTLKMARRLGKGFTSKALGYLAKELGVTPKEEHQKFPGKKLWRECAKGNMEAWEENRTYNVGDIITMVEIFDILKRYDPSINFQAFHSKPTCTCGNHSFYKDDFIFTKQGRFQRYRCHDCGKPYRGKENLIDKDIRKGFFQ
jgi:uncharacterized protein YprB with RNaseH-like and TPR domain